jgi:hypothetical protein
MFTVFSLYFVLSKFWDMSGSVADGFVSEADWPFAEVDSWREVLRSLMITQITVDPLSALGPEINKNCIALHCFALLCFIPQTQKSRKRCERCERCVDVGWWQLLMLQSGESHCSTAGRWIESFWIDDFYGKIWQVTLVTGRQNQSSMVSTHGKWGKMATETETDKV